MEEHKVPWRDKLSASWANQSVAIAYVTLRTSRGIRMLFDQSERGHSVRTGCTSRGVGTMFDQSEHGYSVRHRGTYAFRPIRARL